MAKERISSNVPRKTSVRVTQAAAQLGVSVSRYIEIAVETELSKLDIRKDLKRLKQNNAKLVHERDTARVERDKATATAEAARKQRDGFKSKFEEAQQKFTEAISKIEALQERGLLARLFNRNPTI